MNDNLNKRLDNNCKSYILFLSDPLMTRQVIGAQTESRVVLISRSTQWKLREFLSSEKSSNIVNLLVIGESLMSDSLRASIVFIKAYDLCNIFIALALESVSS